MKVTVEHTDLVGRVFRDIARSAGLDPDIDQIMSFTVDRRQTLVEVAVCGADGKPEWENGELVTRFVAAPTISYNWKVE